MLTGSVSATAADGVRWMHDLCAALKISKLSEFGLTRKMLPELVAKSKNASSMKGNPIALTDAELTEILERAL